MAGVRWDKDSHSSRQAWLPWSCLICFNSTELSTLCHAESVPQGSSQDEKVKPLSTGAESKCVNRCLLSCQNYILNCSVATEIPSPRTQCPSFRTLSAKDSCRMALNRNQAGLNMNHRICLVTQDSTRKCLIDLGALRSVGFARDLRSDGAVIDSWGGGWWSTSTAEVPICGHQKKECSGIWIPPSVKRNFVEKARGAENSTKSHCLKSE